VANRLLGWLGVELDAPLVTQVSRFDPWKDQPGVVEAYRMVKEEVPTLKLALVGFMALDDPEGWGCTGRSGTLPEATLTWTSSPT